MIEKASPELVQFRPSLPAIFLARRCRELMAAVSLERMERDGIELNRQVQLVRSLLAEIDEARKKARALSKE